jgi:hypothetical protein
MDDLFAAASRKGLPSAHSIIVSGCFVLFWRRIVMKQTLNRRRLLCVLGVGVAVVAVLLLVRGLAAEKPPPIPLNMVDLSKTGIESPTKRLLAGQTTPGSTSPASEFVNPKVEPGKVHWHKTFADACTAAKKSGKPVLLFQMMGKLDQRFC